MIDRFGKMSNAVIVVLHDAAHCTLHTSREQRCPHAVIDTEPHPSDMFIAGGAAKSRTMYIPCVPESVRAVIIMT